MKSDKYKNCVVIYRDFFGTKILYSVCFYDKNGYSNWCMKDTGREVKFYKTVKGAENMCKKYGYKVYLN